MEKKHSFKWWNLFNLFDVVVLLIAVALGAILLFLTNGSSQSNTTVRYTVEFTNMQNGTAALIQEGDELEDRVKKYDLGKVLSVEVAPTSTYVTDAISGRSYEASSITLETALVVLEAPATETEQDILVSGGYKIKIGTLVSAKGPGYSCYGTVLAIDLVEGGES